MIFLESDMSAIGENHLIYLNKDKKKIDLILLVMF